MQRAFAPDNKQEDIFMTRTQKLSLFTWQLSDPVDLSQVNENFDRLDRNGCRTEAALWNSAIGLLAAEHLGYATSHAESAAANALRDPSRLDSYDNFCFGENGAVLLAQGAQNRTCNLNHVNLTSQRVKLLEDYVPEGFATLTGMRLEATYLNSYGSTVTLYLYCGEEVVAQSSHAIDTDSPASMNFSFQYRLDPNRTYNVRASCPAVGGMVIQATKLTLLTTALTYTTGTFQTTALSVPSGAARLRLLCSTSGAAPTVQLATAGGGWTSLSLSARVGSKAQLYTGQLALPDGLQSVRLRFTLSGAGNAIRDYAFILF